MGNFSETEFSWIGLKNNCQVYMPKKEINTILLSEVLNEYGKKYITSQLLLNGSSNSNWKVQADSGSYILKCMRFSYKENFIDYHNWLTKTLVNKGFFYVPNVCTSSGDTVLSFEGYLWQLRPYIEGRPYRLGNVEDCVLSVKVLSKLHNIITVENQPISDFVYWSYDVEYKIKSLRQIYDKYFGSSECKEILQHYENTINQLNKSKYKCHKFFSTIIHGDYHGGNLLFNNCNLNAIIDWDNSNLGPRIYDLSKSMYLLCRYQHGVFKINYDLIELFIKEYSSKTTQVSEEELAVISLLLALNYIPKPEYIYSFGDNIEKLCWYLDWTYQASSFAKTELSKISDLELF